ncbi:cytochrome P450 [Pluteus cervinus]|uniref:Cytochrome P450 n=1 Tax=Pluteus cervinus TaxID=181527 RepID=A0ACD3B6N7_9AGAR|nr:cytochrome P450 [Pluteus cervinus]
MAYSPTTWALLTFSFVWLLLKVVRKPKHPEYPPSPKKPWPIIRNVPHVPTSRPWLTYTAWGKEHNNKPLHLEALGQHMIILNNVDDAIELMEKRSSIYSDKPDMPLMTLMGLDFNATFLRYGNIWREHRKAFQLGFRKEMIGTYHPIIELETNKFLRRLIAHPKDLKEHCQFFPASIVMSIVYGHELESSEDPILVTTKRAIQLGNPTIMTGALLMITFPVLLNIPRWLPGGGFHDVAARSRKAISEMIEMPYAIVKDRMQNGVDKPSLVQDLLEKQEAKGVDDESVLKNVAGSAFGAGVDTTDCALGTLFLALSLHPEVQKRARSEIASVTGMTRLPVFNDRPSLPYVEAICRELRRWRPEAPAGVPRATSQDDIYQGYFIPKGSMIFFNTWGMTHNPDIYPDPEEFKPERFLNTDGSLNDDDCHLTFGFGRRICPGRYLASDIVWLAAVRIIATLELSDPKDPATGESIDLDKHQYSNETLSHPPRFICTIKSTEYADNLLRSEEE